MKTFIKALALGIAPVTAIALTAAPAAAQSKQGIAVVDLQRAVATSAAYSTARTQIQTTYKAQIDSFTARKTAIDTDLKTKGDALQAALKAAGGKPTRDDLTVTATVSSYQLPFVEHCIRNLKSGGRAAIVVADNVLFEDGRGRELRRLLMDRCDLHTILRLPTGIFYAQGVKTNVIFLTRGKTETGNTKAVWIYDLRAQMPKFGKTTPLAETHFEGFEKAFGANPFGAERGPDEGETGRWRQFKREDIAARGDNLDIAWLRETEEEAEEGLTEPEDIAAAILGHLQVAMLEIEALTAELGDDVLEAAQ